MMLLANPKTPQIIKDHLIILNDIFTLLRELSASSLEAP